MQTPQLFIGIDVHKKSWSVSIRTDLFEHKTFNMPSEPDKLIIYVNQHFKNYLSNVVMKHHAVVLFLIDDWQRLDGKSRFSIHLIYRKVQRIRIKRMTRWIVETWLNNYNPVILREYTYPMSKENS